jgi:hypothetical protein
LRVVHEGEKKLNITFPEGFAEKLVEGAWGSVYLVRQGCYRACEISGLYRRADESKIIGHPLNAKAILKEISEGSIDYSGQIISLFGLDSVELQAQEREERLKDWVLISLLNVTPKDMQKGIPLKRLRSLVSRRHPQHYHPSENQIERVMKAILSAQLAQARQNLFDYDRQDKTVRCIDKGLILWRTRNGPDTIEHLVFEGEMPGA